MDVTGAGLSDFAGKFGFPALLVLVLLYGLYKLLDSSKQERLTRDERDVVREGERRAERKEDREAHLNALGKHTEAITLLGAGMVRLEAKVDNLDRDVTDLKSKG